MITAKDVLWSQLWGAFPLQVSPKEELMWRLNMSLKGKNPGLPVNWKGLS